MHIFKRRKVWSGESWDGGVRAAEWQELHTFPLVCLQSVRFLYNTHVYACKEEKGFQ